MEHIKLLKQTKKGKWLRYPVTLEREKGRLVFVECPIQLKDEIKSMAGSHWHGRDDEPKQYWSASDCTRNNFQLDYMTGGDPYANWDKDLCNYSYSRPLYEHQKLMSDHCLTYHYQILAAEMGVGKTLSAIEVMEKADAFDPWWIGPKSAIAAVELEFEKWGLTVQPKMMTYDRLRIDIERWEDGMPAPQMVFFDESQRLKSGVAKRTKAAQHLADSIRREWGWDGYVVLMSGSPAPKAPIDWHAQCEVCYPGFLKEGSVKAFERRLGIFEKRSIDGSTFFQRKTWRDNEDKCEICGELDKIYDEDDNGVVLETWTQNPRHLNDPIFGTDDTHDFVPSKNEVAFMYDRLKGLVLPLKKADCLDIPDKIYREIVVEPSSTIKRVAKALAQAAPTAIQGITWLRELSDGFQYKDVQNGMEACPVCKGEKETLEWFDIESGERAHINTELFDACDGDLPEFADGLTPEMAAYYDRDAYEQRLVVCSKCDGAGEVPHMVRETKEIRCPKAQVVRDMLEENEDQGRLVIFAGFRGSIDRIVDICHKQQWDVVRVDGRGWKTMKCDGQPMTTKVKPLNYWANLDNPRVVFVAHPESGGTGLTLTESRMTLFYSNDFKPESRIQAEDRIHRPGIDLNKGATIVDIFHLGTDRKVLEVLRDNRRLEQMTLTELKEAL